MVANAGYLLACFYKISLCGIGRLLDAATGGIAAALGIVMNAIGSVLDASCRVLRNLPFPANIFGGFLCNVLQQTIGAAASVVIIIIRVTLEAVRAAFDLFYLVTVAAALIVAWIIKWAFGRTAEYTLGLAVPDAVLTYKRVIPMHVVVLMADDNSPGISSQDLDDFERGANERLAQCGVSATFTRRFVSRPEYASGFVTETSIVSPRAFRWFTCMSPIFEPTIFFVDSLADDRKGVTLPVLTSYCFIIKKIAEDQRRAVVAHEFGHLCDIWGHAMDPQRVMFSPSSNASVNYDVPEKILIHTSRFGQR
jgi:hypothetical protein